LVSVSGEDISIKNDYDFINLDHLDAVYRIERFEENTQVINSGVLTIPNVAAGKQGVIRLPSHISNGWSNNDCWITISLRLKSATSWADAGHEISWSQHRLDAEETLSIPRIISPVSSYLRVSSSKIHQRIYGPDFSLIFDRARGSLTQWTTNGKFILDSTSPTPLSISVWRAPTDNDLPSAAPFWKNYGLDTMTSQLRSSNLKHLDSGEIQFTTTTFLSPPVLAWGFTALTIYTISRSGSLTIKVHLSPSGSAPKFLPRVGLDVLLADDLDNAKWFGLGPGESYADKKASQKIGIYSATTDQLHTPYDVPQENGNRMETRWCKMVDGMGKGVRASVAGSKGVFQWAAGRYGAGQLEGARHPRDLKKEKKVFWRLDAESAGVGSGACGPSTKEEYQVQSGEKDFEFCLERVCL